MVGKNTTGTLQTHCRYPSGWREEDEFMPDLYVATPGDKTWEEVITVKPIIDGLLVVVTGTTLLTGHGREVNFKSLHWYRNYFCLFLTFFLKKIF